jgi:hypothetical protein
MSVFLPIYVMYNIECKNGQHIFFIVRLAHCRPFKISFVWSADGAPPPSTGETGTNTVYYFYKETTRFQLLKLELGNLWVVRQGEGGGSSSLKDDIVELRSMNKWQLVEKG